MTGENVGVSWDRVDGVRVVWAPTPGPLTASLLFRVGSADESLPTKGTTHIVEHLALHPLGLQPHYQNGSVGPTITSFDTSGDPSEVVHFLREVCLNLSSLPLDRLPAELRILETEEGRRGGGAVPAMLAWRFGPNGPGLAPYEELARRSMDGPALQAWASTAFTKDNAVLVMTGPPPAGLELPLPDGPRRATQPLVDVLPEFPAWFPSQVPDVAVHSLLERTVGAAAYAAALNRSLVDTLRFQLGLAYSPAVHYDPYDATTAQLMVVADAHPEQLQQVADVVCSTMSRLADVGPTQEQVDEYHDARGRGLEDPNRAAGEAFRQAVEHLFAGTVTSFEQMEQEAAALTVEDVHRAAREAWSRALFALPDDVHLGTSDVVAAPTASVDEPVTGRTHVFLGRSDGGPSELVLGTDGVSLRGEDGHATVRFATCRAALAWPDGARRLFANDGVSIQVEPALWSDGAAIVAAIDRATPGVRVVMPARDAEAVPQPPVSEAAGLPRLAKRTRILLGILGALLLVVGTVITASAVGSGGPPPPLATVILIGSGGLLWAAIKG